MIAPPQYKCECITLDKVKGIQKLEEALTIVEKIIKEKQGTFKIINKPQIIGAKEDKDIDDIMAKINDDDEDSAASEDNEEGMGDVDLGDDLDEEHKEEEQKRPSKKGKAKKESEDEDEEDDDDS